MPQIFKALASITAWILFIGGCAGILGILIGQISGGQMFEPWPLSAAVGILGNTISLIGAVVVMKLRQMLE